MNLKVSRMHAVLHSPAARALVLAVCAGLALAGCESLTGSLGKKIDYKSVATAPALEVPPDLVTPQYDDRYNVATASGLAARNATRPRSGGDIAPNANADARIMRAGTERWLHVKATPDQAWNICRQFWPENGFALAVEQPNLGIMETDWAENRAELPPDFLRDSIGKLADVFYTTYKRDKFRTRLERGNEPGTMDIYISMRRMEQVPTTTIQSVSPAGFAWAVMPPNPNIEAEFLTKLMIKFGVSEPVAVRAVAATSTPGALPEQARLEKAADGSAKLYVDDSFDRVWRRVGLALDRVGFTVVDRDRSKGIYFVRYANPESDTKKDTGWLSKLMFWKDNTEKPEQYQIVIAEAAAPPALVTVQDANGGPDKTANGEKILALLKDQLK
jgi:outer membrane protein assembly factor BamC